VENALKSAAIREPQRLLLTFLEKQEEKQHHSQPIEAVKENINKSIKKKDLSR